jgi:beta-lactamase superfamily II metal-dependent hydrolase
MAKQLARKVNRITTSSADINKLSTVIKIYNNKYAILLTSDAVKKSFVTLRNSISHEVVLAQVPHHGSFRNIDEKFWDSVIKTKKCPAVFSVGDEPKDKLPNKETVAFFDIRGYDVHSTSSVYGINDYFGFSTSTQNPRSTILNTFSKLRATTQPNQPSSKYNRSHKFDLL